MRYTLLLLVASLLIASCGDSKKKATQEIQKAVTTNTSTIGRINYAVVWNWTTTELGLITENTENISEELSALWENDIVENVYYDSDSKNNKLAHLPNISFYLKADNEQEARETLNNLTIVKKGLSAYSLYPVGNLWLDRKFKTINEKGLTKSFVAIWNTNNKPTNEQAQSQNDVVLNLWNEGTIENVYFDIEGTQKPSSKTDFVFYVNANSEEESKTICESLPYYKQNIATYELHAVGVFWMGKYSRK